MHTVRAAFQIFTNTQALRPAVTMIVSAALASLPTFTKGGMFGSLNALRADIRPMALYDQP
ncbi:hypothetical protein [Pseudochrobactrum sp. MP213Fo]|uniref:hypothetical protein n=1 Tax=Pseudochrobactrum sp. MP213Fo TaxID=3022250 RepID=UPI003B9E8DA0